MCHWQIPDTSDTSPTLIRDDTPEPRRRTPPPEALLRGVRHLAGRAALAARRWASAHAVRLR